MALNADLELKKLLKNLKGFEPKLKKNVLNTATRRGAKLVQEDAQGNVGSDLNDGKHQGVKKGSRREKAHSSEELKHAIIVKKKSVSKTLKAGQGNNTVYQVGINLFLGKAWYAHIVEYGSKLHPARPFMTPAFEQSGNKVLNEMTKYLKLRIPKILKKGL